MEFNELTKPLLLNQICLLIRFQNALSTYYPVMCALLEEAAVNLQGSPGLSDVRRTYGNDDDIKRFIEPVSIARSKMKH